MPRPWLWVLGGVVVFFTVPWIGTDVLGLQPDLYYLFYFSVALVWSLAFLSRHREQLRELWRQRWGWSLATGAVAGAVVVTIVLGGPATDHPEGWRWWFEIGWRGLVYGAVDTVVLFVVPAACAHLLVPGERRGALRRAGLAALTLVLSLLMSASYHLGYADYRDSDLRSPLVGTAIGSSAAVVTGNPVGAFLTHVPAHVAAVVHQYDGGPTQMLPPRETAAYPDRGDPDVAAALAAAWLVAVVAGGVVVLRRRREAT